MSDTTALRARATGWTIADGERRTAPRRQPATPATGPGSVGLTLDAQDLAAGVGSLAERAVDGTVAGLRLTPGGLEITVAADDHAFWETAVVPTTTTAEGLAGGAELSSFAELARQLATDRHTVRLVVNPTGRVRLEGVDLPAVEEQPAPPRRPHAAGLVEQRLELPATLPDGVPIRLEGLAVTLPSPVRSRFVRRGIAMVNLFEAEDGWYLSGIAQGRPMYVLVGRVAVY